MTPGDHRLPFDARRLPSGVYFYALTHDDGTTMTGTMMRVKGVIGHQSSVIRLFSLTDDG